MTSTRAPRALARTTTRVAAAAAAADAVWILIFAGIGRHSHDEHMSAFDVLGTAWPFLAGALVGWLAIHAWRRPLPIWRSGVAVWAGAWAVGMVLRVLTGQGIEPSFLLVAVIFLGLGLVGWRAVVGWFARRSAR